MAQGIAARLAQAILRMERRLVIGGVDLGAASAVELRPKDWAGLLKLAKLVDRDAR